MAKRIGLTMRIANAEGYAEPRDALAHDWAAFMARCLPDCPWIPIPNVGNGIRDFITQWQLEGFILTGGNDLGRCPRRDDTEKGILEHALAQRLPVLGVCRGLQVIQKFFGGPIHRCESSEHVARRHAIHFINSAPANALPSAPEVNSFHSYGVQIESVAPALQAFATTTDGWAEGIRHPQHPIVAVQWHPERETLPTDHDKALIHPLFAL